MAESASGLSPASLAMMARSHQIIANWADAARRSVGRARDLPAPILLNTMPAIVEQLARLLTPAHFRQHGVDLAALAQEHGGERARLSDYDTTALIDEFQILRHTLFEELHRSGMQLSHDQRSAMDASIDRAIRESVTAFALVQANLREQFIAAITHDLRAPLANACLAAQLIEGKSNNPEIKTLADRIVKNTNRIEAMTRDLLDCIVFNNGERLRLKISAFDMAELAREVGAEINGAQLAMQLQSVPGYWCRESMKRALENLLGNALKYGEPGQPVLLQVKSEGLRVQISVHNKGRPIPADQIEAIFQIYRRAEARVREGWGVGLPYARRVAESHGGSIVVSSNAVDGTTFMIDVPCDARPFDKASAGAKLSPGVA
jgi:signal transduction histidine kinase